MWLIGVEVEQETSTPPPKKNPGSAPESYSLFNRWKAKNTLLLSLVFSLSPYSPNRSPYISSLNKKLWELVKR